MLTSQHDARLRQFVLMLSSDQPGEVVAAARAIDRTLKREGMDWHGFADRLAQAQPHHDARPAPVPPFPDVCGWLVNHRQHLLTPWERAFLLSVQKRKRLTPKQRMALGNIISSAGVHTHA